MYTLDKIIEDRKKKVLKQLQVLQREYKTANNSMIAQIHKQSSRRHLESRLETLC